MYPVDPAATPAGISAQLPVPSADDVKNFPATAPVVSLMTGAVAVPVNVGLAIGAFSESNSSSASWTLVEAMVPAGINVTAEAEVDVDPAARGSVVTRR
jgi:hypothetical protein